LGCEEGFFEEDFVAGGAAVPVGVGPVAEQVAVVAGAVLVGDIEGGDGVVQGQGVGGVDRGSGGESGGSGDKSRCTQAQ
jgi:hypothetical protein